MSGIRWLETDVLANRNISSPLAIGAYTAAADRAVMCQAFVDQAAGGGDYVMYCTLQIGGAGSSYVILPKTTMTAAAGETAIAGQSGWINVRSGDVVTVYVDGLAGDTTTPDTIVRWFEDAALQPTTADRTLDVSSTGEAGLDFDNIKAATAPTTLTNITVPTVTTLTNAPTGMALEATLTAMKGAGWTIETLKAIYNAVLAGSGGAGAITWPYTLTSSVDATPIADADVWVTSDLAGAVVIASGTTNALGVVTFYLDAGTVYIWRQKTGWDFTNPDTEVVS